MTVKPNSVFRDGSKLIHVTGESPRQFSGILFVVYEGDTPESVVESAKTVDQLRGLPRVDKSTLSVPWKKALKLPEERPTPNRSNTRSSRRVMTGARSVTPDHGTRVRVVETHYVPIYLGLGAWHVHFFMACAALSVLFGVDPWYLAMCVILTLVAGWYEWATKYLAAKGTIRERTTTTTSI
jgi:hypothetical protein